MANGTATADLIQERMSSVFTRIHRQRAWTYRIGLLHQIRLSNLCVFNCNNNLKNHLNAFDLANTDHELYTVARKRIKTLCLYSLKQCVQP